LKSPVILSPPRFLAGDPAAPGLQFFLRSGSIRRNAEMLLPQGRIPLGGTALAPSLFPYAKRREDDIQYVIDIRRAGDLIERAKGLIQIK
jgi:hypothetical protein